MKRYWTNRIALTAIAVTMLIGAHSDAMAQEVVGLTAVESSGEASLVFDLGSGKSLLISLSNGKLVVGGAEVARYTEGGTFEKQWRGLVERADLSIAEVLERLLELDIVEANAEEQAGVDAVKEAVAGLAVAEARFSGAADAGGETIAIAAAPLTIDIAPPVRVAPPPRIVVGDFEPSSSFVGGLAGGVMNLLAVYVALAFMGLGLLVFAPKQLETVADTVWHSFWRSFLAGLFAQPLILPVFAMMVVGLALTVVGVIVIPFAVSAFLVALLLAVLGGFVAAARSIGEIYLRRKMAQGQAVATWGSYRYIVYGLLPVLGIWLPVALLGWIPVAGTILMVTAAFTTWMIATAGFGAALISRGGVRGTFVRQMDLALTDEQYWTEEAVPTQPPMERIRRSRQ
jgi:hypothetical protein